MDTIILASLNVGLFLTLAMVEYLSHAKKREIFYETIYLKETKSIPTFLFFLPPAWFFYVREKVLQNKNKSENVSFHNEFTLPKLALLNAALLLLSFNLNTLFKLPFYLTLLAGIVAQISLFLVLRNKEQKIKDELQKKLPEILDIMARVYRVHTDLRVTIAEVAEKMREPALKSSFNEIVRLSRFGYTVEDAMVHVAKKIQSEDFDFIVTSIKLNIPVGGDLPRLFEHTAKLLRQRKEAKNEIDNLMFQSKISSIISALLVPMIIVVAFTSSIKYQQVLLFNPTGRLVFFGCLIWWIIGVIMIRKNSRIRI